MTKRFANPFTPLDLNGTAADELERLARMFVQDHISLYEQFLHEENSRVDPQRWKFVSEQGACQAYSERRGSIDDSSSSSGDDMPIHADTPRSELPTILVTGTKDPFSTEVFIKGFLNPAGRLMRSIMLHSAAAALLSVSRNVYCAQMKKLVWTIRNRRLTIDGGTIANVSDTCVTCKAPPRHLSTLLSGNKRRHTCKICFRYVCTECREVRKLCFMLPDHRLVEQEVCFCKMCLNDALSSKAQAIARDEVVVCNEVYEWSNTYGSSSSNEPVLIDDLNDH
ncbi:hypothetical protein PF010_g26206 [Phytophthora fragariae]|uniref:FYVE-type domain-containing protein n=1 Tax=Phytophthora fragariae TaxID=53985 RepID=A0A6G0JYC2_9STRA|nr:hypothetical protein PF010_g26206 [Phytophthora fragariae]